MTQASATGSLERRDSHDSIGYIAELIRGVPNGDARRQILGAGDSMRLKEITLPLSAAPSEADILDSLPAKIACLDAAGIIVEINEAWRHSAATHEFPRINCGVGCDYLAVCDNVAGPDSLPASRAAAGIRSVLLGAIAQFSMEYVLGSPSGDSWFLLLAAPIGTGRPTGVTLMHLDISARKHDESNVWRFAAAMDALADGVFLVDRASMMLTYVNDAACRMHGLTREETLAMRPWEGTPVSREELERKYDKVVADGGTGEIEEVPWIRPDGTEVWLEMRRHAHCVDGAISLVILARDITARRMADSRIVYLNHVYAILSGINALIVRVADREELFREACRICIDKGGFPACWIGTYDRESGRMIPVASAGMGSEYRDAVSDTLLHGSLEVLERSHVISAVRDKQIRVCNDSLGDKHVLVRNHHEAHGIRAFAMLPLIVADEAIGVLALYAGEVDFFHQEELRLLSELASDISFAIDHIAKQEKLDYLAFYDALTGLANRYLFLDRLAQCTRTAHGANVKFAVCVIDVERFRNINDSLGRPAGDALLRQVAQWLVYHLGDPLLVGRLDSDHFSLVVFDVENESEAALLVENLINTFAAHLFDLDGTVYRLAIKVGVAIFPDDGTDPNDLFKNAGSALTKAKAGDDRYLFYAQRMTETVAGRLGMENQLRQALERNEFVIHYQPKMDLGTGLMVGAEALLRWNDPRSGLVPPARFIPVLEETGLIIEVGRWVLGKAIEDHTRWRDAGHAGVRIAVNVSPLQLRHSNFVTDIQRYAAHNPRVSTGLELEITESLIMEDVRRSIAALEVIREIGITIAIDDFGTGYSSLSHLAKLPVDTLKIDRSFILDMSAGDSGVSLVSTIVNLAHSLDLRVVAEGVETKDQEDLLRRLLCDEVQGYLYSKPLPAETFEERFLK